MNLIKELKPFNKTLDAWKKGQTIRDPKAIGKMAVIWQNFGKENAGTIYGRTNHKVPLTDVDCRSCVNDMFDFLYNWRNIELRNPDNGVYHKMVPGKKGSVTTVKPKTGLSLLSWADLKTLAKSKDVKVHGKKRPALEAELEAL